MSNCPLEYLLAVDLDAIICKLGHLRPKHIRVSDILARPKKKLERISGLCLYNSCLMTRCWCLKRDNNFTHFDPTYIKIY